MTSQADDYWHKTRRLTFVLLLLWFVTTFALTWFAREINEIVVLGFPLGFYMAAQGALFVYLAIIWWYNRRMRKIDAQFNVEDT